MISIEECLKVCIMSMTFQLMGTNNLDVAGWFCNLTSPLDTWLMENGVWLKQLCQSVMMSVCPGGRSSLANILTVLFILLEDNVCVKKTLAVSQRPFKSDLSNVAWWKLPLRYTFVYSFGDLDQISRSQQCRRDQSDTSFSGQVFVQLSSKFVWLLHRWT